MLVKTGDKETIVTSSNDVIQLAEKISTTLADAIREYFIPKTAETVEKTRQLDDYRETDTPVSEEARIRKDAKLLF